MAVATGPEVLTRERIAPDLLGLVVPLASLVQHPRNPNEGDAASIAGSLETFAQYAPLVVQASTRFIVKGNHTWQAAQRLGWRWIAANVMDLTDEAALGILVGDNRHSELSQRDPDRLAALLVELRDGDQLAGTGYDPADIDALLAELGQADEGDDAGAPPALPADRPQLPLVTRPGDLWRLGPHRLLCGDATDPADLARLLAGQRAAVVVTSPPYADQRDYDERSEYRPVLPDDYVAWFLPIAAQLARHLADDGGLFLNIKAATADGQRLLYVLDLILALVRQGDWRLVDEFCWHNTNEGIPGGYQDRFKNAWEPVYHLARQRAIKFRPEHALLASAGAFSYQGRSVSGSGSGIGLGVHAIQESGWARPSNVLVFGAETHQAEHTAPFPEKLPDFFIRAYSDPGEIVLDPFGGAGTTLVACEAARALEGQPAPRRARLLEISPRYCDLAIRRWRELTGREAVREDGAAWGDLLALAGGGLAGDPDGNAASLAGQAGDDGR